MLQVYAHVLDYLIIMAGLANIYQSFELFYQIGLADFGNFGRIEFDPPLSLSELLTAAVEAEKTHHADDAEAAEIDWDEARSTVYSLIVSKREILSHYFSLDITEDGMVTGMPLLLKGYMPNLGKLPAFLLRLGPNVSTSHTKTPAGY